MYHPTTRVMTVLALLRAHRQMSGAELARRLEVDIRTVRRYITMLQDLGIPVEGERGRAGAYALQAGYTLPPLMFTDDEALALLLSLRAARETLLTGFPVALEGAAAKIEAAMSDELRQRIQATQASMIIELNTPVGVPTAAEILFTLSTAISAQRRIELNHSAYQGSETTRVIDPYSLVYRLGRWYLVGYCHLREAIRTFRVDRILSARTLEGTFLRPTDFDPLPHVERALASTPGIYHVEVIFNSPMEAVKAQIPAAVGQLTFNNEEVLLTAYVQRLSWIAGFLAGLTLPMRILSPEALKTEMRCLIERAHASIDAS